MMQRSPAQTKAESSFTPLQSGLLQRKCATCGQHTLAGGDCTESQSERSPLQRRSTNQAEPSEVPPIVHEVLRSPGQPLDPSTCGFMESRFGHDFSQVRVHTDMKAAKSAQAIDALAYTVRRDIVFGAGQYNPKTSNGKRLLVHELTHTLQQRNPVSSPLTFAEINSPTETEADRIASDVTTVTGQVIPTTQPIDAQIQRQEKNRSIKSGFNPAPAGPYNLPSPPPPPSPTPVPSPPKPPTDQRQCKGAPPGTNSIFPDNTPTKGLARWNYVVYSDHMRLGNRVINPNAPLEKRQVIGTWPWMNNNPGNLTVDVKPPKGRNQEKRAFGLGAFENVAARGDLAIFPDMATGRQALKTWIETNYKGLTISQAVEKHLGPNQTHIPGIDNPGRYAQGVEQNTKLSSSTVIDEKLLSSSAQLDAIVTAFGKVEGVENTGIVYRCSGRDLSNDAQLEDWKKKHNLVKALPEATPPEIQALLGCKEFCDKQKQQ